MGRSSTTHRVNQKEILSPGREAAPASSAAPPVTDATHHFHLKIDQHARSQSNTNAFILVFLCFYSDMVRQLNFCLCMCVCGGRVQTFLLLTARKWFVTRRRCIFSSTTADTMVGSCLKIQKQQTITATKKNPNFHTNILRVS